ADGENARSDHVAQGGAGCDVDCAAVIRTRGAGHDPRVFAELTPDFLDDVLSGGAHGPYGEGRKEEDEHPSDKGSNEDVHVRYVDRQSFIEWNREALLYLVEEGAEEQEGGQSGCSNGRALCERLDGVADSVAR